MTTYRDRKSDAGLWLKGCTWCGIEGKTRAGRLWNNLVTRTTGRHKDKCYDFATNGFTDFQEFAEWCQEQYGYLHTEDNGRFWQLDKDILGNGRLYSPTTCCFVPSKLNGILVEQESHQGLLLGTKMSENSQRFIARCRDVGGRKVHIGVYDTEEQAHHAWYEFKRNVIKEVLELYTISPLAEQALRDKWDI